MKRMTPLLLLGIVGGVITAALVRRAACDGHLNESVLKGDSRCWLRCGLGLDEATCDAIDREQADFSDICAGLCQAVFEAKKSLGQLPADASAEARAEAEARVKQAEETRRAGQETHVRRLAGLMPPEARRRYLEFVLPRLRSHDRTGISPPTSLSHAP